MGESIKMAYVENGNEILQSAVCKLSTFKKKLFWIEKKAQRNTEHVDRKNTTTIWQRG